MKLPLDENLNPVPVVSLGRSLDLTDDQVIPGTAVVRIKALTQCRIWTRTPESEPEGVGVLFSEGETEYVKVPAGYLLQVQGTVNLTEVY